MTQLDGLLAECQAADIRLHSGPDGQLVVNAPRGALTPDLVDQIRRHRDDLLAKLAAGADSPPLPVGPVTDDDRRTAHAEAVERANAAYRGGAIDWDRIDTAEAEIFSAQTRDDLDRAVDRYVAVVLGAALKYENTV